MAQPIYKLFLGKSTEAWHQLSQEEQNNLFAKANQAFEKCGGKRVALCNAQGFADQWAYFGLEQFPDIEAVQKYSEMLSELKWFRYIDGISALGIEWQPVSTPSR